MEASDQSQSHSPDENYFNDLSQQQSHGAARKNSNEQPQGQGAQPKSKRVACVLCRKRKLRCDGARPACATCTRLSHECAYDEVRRKSGPKRGYVKALEARLAQVETLLKTQDPMDMTMTENSGNAPSAADATAAAVPATQGMSGMQSDIIAMSDFTEMDITGMCDDTLLQQAQWESDGRSNLNATGSNQEFVLPTPTSGPAYEEDPISAWGSMIGLGIEEPLPSPEIVEELNSIYFEKLHTSYPLIHRPRYLMAMANTAPNLRPPVCLQYIVWALAASITDRYEPLQDQYYKRCRHYLERDEMRGQGEGAISIQHVQALFLCASYEFKMLMFPRAWMSTGKATRLALMLGLHRVDGYTMDVKQCMLPPKDWIEREERRRTFWLCFSEDRYASIGTGWPMTLEETDITTDLPASDEAFERGTPEPSITLEQALDAQGTAKLSSLAGTVVLAAIFGRNLLHLHRPGKDDNDGDLNGGFWQRHRDMDNILLNISLGLPDHLRLPGGMNDPNTVFMNMGIHTSTICLHQAAIFKAEKNRVSSKVSAESKIRCIAAAAEISSIMKMVSHVDLSAVNPFTCFCLYVASRVFVQYLKSRPNDGQVQASLHFLLSAMHAIKRKNPLAESFLVQLDVDLEFAGMDNLRSLRVRAARMNSQNGQVTPCTEPDVNNHHLAKHSCEWNSANDPDSVEQRTFGNNGLAMHNQPARDKWDPKSYWKPNKSGFHGIIPHSATNSNVTSTALPSRQKTPSAVTTDPSPRPFSDEVDGMGSGSHSSNYQSPSSSQAPQPSVNKSQPETFEMQNCGGLTFYTDPEMHDSSRDGIISNNNNNNHRGSEATSPNASTGFNMRGHATGMHFYTNPNHQNSRSDTGETSSTFNLTPGSTDASLNSFWDESGGVGAPAMRTTTNTTSVSSVSNGNSYSNSSSNSQHKHKQQQQQEQEQRNNENQQQPQFSDSNGSYMLDDLPNIDTTLYTNMGDMDFSQFATSTQQQQQQQQQQSRRVGSANSNANDSIENNGTPVMMMLPPPQPKTGLTPGASGAIDMFSMDEAEWGKVIASFEVGDAAWRYT